ncbi:MAG: 16S rRNA (uracil(1498)-N(3))-methyltransferase [Candidatus Omnitrophica bacterium]|nr:16S rRNA (uracil(1498)-N(3))-methyltransferase [Candidatus Omnitrophota bacterium]MCF7876808.1 16S rRNA (uracil(1498)-N(3))-methyltransferase [Candidatus Omnitrophota bacterium]MCF7878103.1 16S rRNA (uracil(1498)-N(3))-methyltransferase [Candidatus Omnitrophota bacterium]MCF7892993.1 16S rRNA (uracil(1498)-N(3))-methyltransferase [Candidatus Omnitrophota bacterium]
MAKIRLYIPPQEIKESIILDKRGPLHKLKNVLRLKKGQKVYVFNGEGREWEYKINQIKQKNIAITKINKTRKQPITKPMLTLGFPLIQEKRIDFILQKATELGVFGFIPFFSSRTTKTSRKNALRIASADSKIKRWEKIIIEACRQSERLWIPKIGRPLALNQLIKKDFSLKLIAFPDKNSKIKRINKNSENILCIVGPEGGFSEKEINNFQKYNCRPIRLSENILRSETAAIFLPGLIKYLTEQTQYESTS